MIYLASPYSHPDSFVREHRYLHALQAVSVLLGDGRWVYSPIVHCHELAKVMGHDPDFSFWQPYDFHMISICSEFMILRIEGWQESHGITAEKAEAERLGKMVIYL